MTQIAERTGELFPPYAEENPSFTLFRGLPFICDCERVSVEPSGSGLVRSELTGMFIPECGLYTQVTTVGLVAGMESWC